MRPREDGDHLAAGPEAVRRRGLHALVGRLPREQGAPVAHRARLLARAVEVAVAIGEQRARRLRVRVDEERHHEDLGVPEDVLEVRHAPQAAGADRDRVLGGMGGADHVEDAEAQRLLVGGVALDDEVGVAPALRPTPRGGGGAARRSRAAPRAPARGAPLSGDGTRRARRDDRRQAVDGGRVARLEAPADHVAPLLDGARHRRSGRRLGGHGQHVPAAAAALGAGDEAGRVERLELGLLGRAAGVRDAHGALPDQAPAEVLGRRLGAHARAGAGRPARRSAPCARAPCARCGRAAASSGRRRRGACRARAGARGSRRWRG